MTHNDTAPASSEWIELMGKDIRIQRCRPSPDPEAALAEVGSIVHCHLRGFYYSIAQEKRLNEQPFEELRDQFFQVGEGDAIPGLELSLRHSRVGETLRCTASARFAFGATGRCVPKAKTPSQSQSQSQRESNKNTNTTSTSNSSSAAEDDDDHDNNDNDDNNNNNNNSSSVDFIAIERHNGVAIIPPHTDVEYEIEIVAHLDERELHPHTVARHAAELEALRDDEEAQQTLMHRLHTVQMMSYRKDCGNRWFSYNEFGRAAKAYSQATKLAESYFNTSSAASTPAVEEATSSIEERIKAIEAQEKAKQQPIAEEDVEVVAVYVACLNNLAACKLSQGDFAATKDLCSKVLQFSPFNAKALLRAAKAALATDAFEECELCLKRLLGMENLEDQYKSSGEAELAKLRRAQANYRARRKEMQQRMADKLFAKKQQQQAQASAKAKENSAKPEVKSSTAAETSINSSSNSSTQQQVDSDAPTQTTTTSTAAAAAPKQSQLVKSSSSNIVLLLSTSLVVVVISLIVAFGKK